MATRNRTLIYKRYRDALKTVRVPTSTSPLQSSGKSSCSGPVIELVNSSLLNPNRNYAPLSTEDPGNSRGAVTVGLPPAWVDVSEEIATNVQRARTKMAELARAHAKALMPSFGDGKEDQHAIESLTQEITNILKRSEKRLQQLSAAGPSEDSNVRKNVQRSLATDLQNLSMELRKKQSTYLKRLRQQKEGQDGVDLEMNLNGGRSIMEDDDLDDMVVESVNELAQIMKDLSVLVIDQGTIVDRIDYNIQNVATTVDEGLKQLQKFDAGIAGGENTKERGDGNVCYSTCYYVLCHVSPPNPEGDNLLIPKPNCLYEPFTYHMLLLTLPAGNPFALWDYGVAGYALPEESGSFELPLLQIRDAGALFVLSSLGPVQRKKSYAAFTFWIGVGILRSGNPWIRSVEWE
ncbi:Syntaxin-43 [Citrus sinensis]|uniref:Syntaxin-43 n=1 Tax=Citrus sinensis TaxID=2711 RepID=A0ACB8KM78_CITSI|nr:Syntaxin-43 [Citrus sinensis]